MNRAGIIEFEQIEVTIPVRIRGTEYTVRDIHHSRPRRKSHKTISPVVYVDVMEAENPARVSANDRVS